MTGRPTSTQLRCTAPRQTSGQWLLLWRPVEQGLVWWLAHWQRWVATATITYLSRSDHCSLEPYACIVWVSTQLFFWSLCILLCLMSVKTGHFPSSLPVHHQDFLDTSLVCTSWLSKFPVHTCPPFKSACIECLYIHVQFAYSACLHSMLPSLLKLLLLKCTNKSFVHKRHSFSLYTWWCAHCHLKVIIYTILKRVKPARRVNHEYITRIMNVTMVKWRKSSMFECGDISTD